MVISASFIPSRARQLQGQQGLLPLPPLLPLALVQPLLPQELRHLRFAKLTVNIVKQFDVPKSDTNLHVVLRYKACFTAIVLRLYKKPAVIGVECQEDFVLLYA